MQSENGFSAPAGKQSHAYMHGMRRLVAVLLTILCLTPPLIFNLRQFSERAAILEDHADILQRLLQNQSRYLAPENNNLDSLVDLASEVMGPNHNFEIYSMNSLLHGSIVDDRFPLVHIHKELATESLGSVEIHAYSTLADRLAAMAGALLAGFSTLFFALLAFGKKIHGPWMDTVKTEKKQQQRLELMANMGSDWIWTTDRNLLVNHITQREHEDYPPVIEGKHLWENTTLLPDVPWARINAAMSSCSTLTFRAERGGKYHSTYLLVRAEPQFGEDGSFQGYVGIITDISFVTMREQIIKGENSKLAAMVDAGAKELLRARNIAEEANKIKARFLSTVSHEIRTPLNAVMGMSNLLAKTPLNFQQREYINTVINSSELLLSIVNDILDLSKMENQKLELSESEFMLEDLVYEVIDMLKEKAQSRGLELIVDIDPFYAGHYLIADRKRLSQILINYISNAIKFTNFGHVIVRAAKLDLPDEGNAGLSLLKLVVEDTGIGIDLHEQEKLFRPFSQVDGDYTRRYDGAGLGLSIVKGLVNLMGGDVGVSSKPGSGTLFWAQVRVRLGDMVEAGLPQKLASTLPPETVVLMVDDNEDTLSLARSGLKNIGIDLLVARSAEEACSLLRNQAEKAMPVTTMLVDWHLGNMTGAQVVHEARKLPLSTIPDFICISARDFAEIPAVERQHFSAVMGKPLNFAALHDYLVRNAADSGVPARMDPSDRSLEKRQGVSILKGMRALLVDDDQIGIMLCQHVLSAQGVVSSTFTSSTLALESLKAGASYDFALIDIEMPELDGISLIKLIKSLPTVRDMKVFVITALALPEETASLQELKIDGLLTKPYPAEDLLVLLEENLQGIQPENDPDIRPYPHREILERLAFLLDASDSLAHDFALDHEQALRGLLAGRFSAFNRALRDYDYPVACRLLQDARRELGGGIREGTMVEGAAV